MYGYYLDGYYLFCLELKWRGWNFVAISVSGVPEKSMMIDKRDSCDDLCSPIDSVLVHFHSFIIYVTMYFLIRSLLRVLYSFIRIITFNHSFVWYLLTDSSTNAVMYFLIHSLERLKNSSPIHWYKHELHFMRFCIHFLIYWSV